jgi:hypothetical protein
VLLEIVSAPASALHVAARLRRSCASSVRSSFGITVPYRLNCVLSSVLGASLERADAILTGPRLHLPHGPDLAAARPQDQPGARQLYRLTHSNLRCFVLRG